MKTSVVALSAAAAALIVSAGAVSPASALSMKDCSAKYQAAKTGGTLGGRSWNDFQRLECAADAPQATAAPASPTKASAVATPTKAPARSPAASGGPVFPSSIAAAYQKQSAGKARMHTCLDQYNANKVTNANAGLEWISKGGGYYSACNKHLKG